MTSTKAELAKALEDMVAVFGPGSFVPEKADALRRARIVLGTALPWEKRDRAGRRSDNAIASENKDG